MIFKDLMMLGKSTETSSDTPKKTGGLLGMIPGLEDIQKTGEQFIVFMDGVRSQLNEIRNSQIEINDKLDLANSKLDNLMLRNGDNIL